MVTVGSASIDMSAAVRNPSGTGPFPAIISIGGAGIPIPATVEQITFGNDAFVVQNDRAAGTNASSAIIFCNLFGQQHSAGGRASTAWLGVTGCSRNGKVAFVMGTLEKRIALMIPQESGSGGSACWHILDSENSKGKAIQTSGQVVSENVWFSSNSNAWTTQVVLDPTSTTTCWCDSWHRGLYVAENDIDWLNPLSTKGYMKGGRLIYQALEVPENVGFSLVGGHNHCQFPSGQTAELAQYMSCFPVNSANEAVARRSQHRYRQSSRLFLLNGAFSFPRILLTGDMTGRGSWGNQRRRAV
ncbi:Putative alpha/Beta hydrolase [Colletotrichum destructivum]|uniref:(4-O-methyl)-D-glucuronate--lignin esterase n=1 Tax=Colletotrichum destructivum TaxID=34406 RepID=A0AAX4IX02_9PEZI|nr:Putative alpha/Beta hydrolase [Colletotrichum destructivum]